MKIIPALSPRRLAGLSLLSFAFALCTPAFGEAPVLEARFNDPITVELRNGGILGPQGSGVSGKPKDLSYVSDLTNFPGGPGPAAIPTVPQSTISNIQALTVTGWYKARGEIKNDTTLFSALHTQLIWEQSGNHWVWRISTKSIDPSVNTMNWFKTPSKPAPLDSWVNPGEWTFIAMVWRREENSVEFFQGSTAVSAILAGKKIVRPESVVPLDEAANFKRTFGNDSNKLERPFDGNIDNLRFFLKGLDPKAIEAIRQADIKGQP